MQKYAQQARDIELIEWSTDIRMRAEIKAGKLLKEMAERRERAKAGDNQYRGSRAVRLPDLDNLASPSRSIAP